MQTKQSLLYNDQTAWCMKNSNFDVTMGSFGGAETCELVGLYMLSQYSPMFIPNFSSAYIYIFKPRLKSLEINPSIQKSQYPVR